MKKQFICNICKIKSMKDSGSYYKQKKKLGYVLCRKCGIKRGINNSVKTKYGNERNNDIIEIRCRNNIEYRSKMDKLYNPDYKEQLSQIGRVIL